MKQVMWASVIFLISTVLFADQSTAPTPGATSIQGQTTPSSDPKKNEAQKEGDKESKSQKPVPEKASSKKEGSKKDNSGKTDPVEAQLLGQVVEQDLGIPQTIRQAGDLAAMPPQQDGSMVECYKKNDNGDVFRSVSPDKAKVTDVPLAGMDKDNVLSMFKAVDGKPDNASAKMSFIDGDQEKEGLVYRLGARDICVTITPAKPDKK